ncbi:mucin-4-like [Ochotona curzoniae]|uniref:mucin-4-like n=1 Tax=Ochotona curzoniae TaxID=130825 RepID=UPI001B34AED2|nr:mucin-4-like [Ochotona curzoniae]
MSTSSASTLATTRNTISLTTGSLPQNTESKQNLVSTSTMSSTQETTATLENAQTQSTETSKQSPTRNNSNFRKRSDSEYRDQQTIPNNWNISTIYIQQDPPNSIKVDHYVNFISLNSGNHRRHNISDNWESSSNKSKDNERKLNGNFCRDLHSGNISNFRKPSDSEYKDQQTIPNNWNISTIYIQQDPPNSIKVDHYVIFFSLNSGNHRRHNISDNWESSSNKSKNNERKLNSNFCRDLHSGNISNFRKPSDSEYKDQQTHSKYPYGRNHKRLNISGIWESFSNQCYNNERKLNGNFYRDLHPGSNCNFRKCSDSEYGDQKTVSNNWNISIIYIQQDPPNSIRIGHYVNFISLNSGNHRRHNISDNWESSSNKSKDNERKLNDKFYRHFHSGNTVHTHATETTQKYQSMNSGPYVAGSVNVVTTTASSSTSSKYSPEESDSEEEPPKDSDNPVSSEDSHTNTEARVSSISPDITLRTSRVSLPIDAELWSSPVTSQVTPGDVSAMATRNTAFDVSTPAGLAGQSSSRSTTHAAEKLFLNSQTVHTHATETTQKYQSMNSGPYVAGSVNVVTTTASSSTSSKYSPEESDSEEEPPKDSDNPVSSEDSHTNTEARVSSISPDTTLRTSRGIVTTLLWTNDGRSRTLSPSPATSLTRTTSTPTTSTVQQGKSIPLLTYGPIVGDTQFVRRTVDFTSHLFKLHIGFPLGSSLRDFLYFTDNGQIIFPDSDNQIFSYPNPPSRGFTAWDTMAVVAPFWDDADFSSHRGTIFYQEYETFYDQYNPLVRQVESWIRRFTNSWSYKAKWTLKITWVDAPAYPAQWTSGTSTYQAVLSTDGSRSYALFLYQSGGMQWDVAQRPGNSVLMGFSSGDGYFANSPLTFRPVWERYRPDQLLNSRLGLRGLQIYRLHREPIPNNRLKCQQWLESQPQWPSWNWNQIACPCTWQQGRWDLRFRPVSSDWWDLGGSRKLCRFSSWQGGVCCSYGSWGELREGWRVHSPSHLEQELEPQNWCCHWNDKPFFCSMYQQRRPPVSCAGYRPPRPGWMFGDPHITTLDGANYTFNGLGDFLLLRAWDGNSSFELQGRTAQTGSVPATNFIAFAAQYNSSSLAPITVQWFLGPNDTIRVLHNNQTVTFETQDAEGRETYNSSGLLLTRNGTQVSASFDGTVAITVMALSQILHASSSLPEEYQGRTEGLLGLWNNNPNDDFRMPNGSFLASGSTEEELFHFGMTWKLNGTDLLGERDDQLPPSFTPIFFSQLLANSSGDGALISGCNGDRQCMYDALAMQDASAGLHTRTLFRTYQEMNATQNQFPPSIKSNHTIEAYKGKTTWIQYTSDSENVTFSLRSNCTDFQLFENGTLQWTPKTLEPFTLEILARSSSTGLSSSLQPKTVVCVCSAESQCLYNQTTWVGNSSLQVADCRCDGDTFGTSCERTGDPCMEPCFPGVSCISGKGCEACPVNMTGDGRHCAALENSDLCQNHSCPVNYCHNQGHCHITLSCQPACTCPPAFTDSRCFLAGNSFTPSTLQELPLRVIQLSLMEDENASISEVNASVAYRLGMLEVRAFLWNSLVEPVSGPGVGSGSRVQHWKVISQFQYHVRGPVIDFLNHQLQDAVVQAFLPQLQRGRWKRNTGPRNNVVFYPISRGDVQDITALNVSTLETYLRCSGYQGYRLAYTPQSGFTCVSPCTEGYCDHGGRCQHLPDGPRCSCVPFSIYSPWGERCEHLSIRLGAFFGILFGALGAVLLLAAGTFVVVRFCACPRVKSSYPLGILS